MEVEMPAELSAFCRNVSKKAEAFSYDRLPY